MKNEKGDRAFVDTVTIAVEHNHIILRAEFDGLLYESNEYEGDLVKWLQAIVDRARNVALGKE